MRRVGVVISAILFASIHAPATSSPNVTPPGLWVHHVADRSNDRLVRYTNHGADAAEWSPDSTKLAYDTGHVFVVDVATGERTRLTPRNEYDTDTTWSPDGASIAFARRTDQSSQGIYIVDVATRQERRLTNEGDLPDWSPDGREIAFRKDGRRGGVFVVDVATHEERKIVGDRVRYLSWSPDGNHIAYSFVNVYVVNRDGTGVTNVSRFLSSDTVSEFSWSPDGSELAYARGGPTLGVVKADGTRLRRLRPKVGGISNPAWSPDGRYILFDTFDAIYKIRPDGTHLRRLTRGYEPSWAPDGSAVAFLRPS